jgi:hypothetical protein
MEDRLRAEAERRWEGLWDKFLDAVIGEFKSVLDWKPES